MKTHERITVRNIIILGLSIFCTMLILSNAYNLHRIEGYKNKAEVLKGE